MSKPKFIQLPANHYIGMKAASILMDDGAEGYGLYVLLMEALSNTNERMLPLSVIPQLAFQFASKQDKVMSIINSYMIVVDTCFYCDELDTLLSPYDNAVKGGTTAAANKTPNQLLERSLKGVKAKKEKKSNVDVLDGTLVNGSVLNITGEDSNVQVFLTIF